VANSNNTVVSLGIHIVDMLGRPVNRIPPHQDLDLIEEIRITVAGTAAGTSVDMAKLGLHVVAMGAIGTDILGDFLISEMTKYNIDTSCIVRKKGVQTSATILPIRSNGERPALHVVGANGEFSIDDVNFDLISKARLLHVGGTSLLPKLDGEPTKEILKFAKEHDVITTFDLVAIRKPELLDIIEPCLPYIDYFMPNLDEASMISGLTNRSEIIKFFLDRGTKVVILKMGEKGSIISYYSGSEVEEIRIPIYKVKVIDTTGCGDAYDAGFICGLVNNFEIRKCGMLGAAAGALVATGLGSDAGIIDLESTINFMEHSETLNSI